MRFLKKLLWHRLDDEYQNESKTFKVSYYSADFGYGEYHFKNASLRDCFNYLIKQRIFDKDYTDYVLTKIIKKKKYNFFGEVNYIFEMTKMRELLKN